MRARYDPVRAFRDNTPILKVFSEYADFKSYQFLGVRPIIKDPIAIFSAEWLDKNFDLAVIVMIRHPCAFASSLKRLDWSFDFSHFLRQSSLMSQYLAPLEKELREFVDREHDIVDQAAMLWKSIYHVVRDYRRIHRDWIFVRHEDISMEPEVKFREIFNTLGIDYTKTIREFIEETTNKSNPVSTDGKVSSIKLHSARSIYTWHHLLTSDEVARVRDRVNDVSSAFYTDNEWV